MANESAFSALADAVIDQLAESFTIRFRRMGSGGAFDARLATTTGGSTVLSTAVSCVRRGGEPEVSFGTGGSGTTRVERVEYLFRQSDLAAAWALGEAIEGDHVLESGSPGDGIVGRVVEVRREVHAGMRRVIVERLANT